MNFKFNVETTKDILFKPSTIELFILNKEIVKTPASEEGGVETEEEFVNIQTVLTQILPTGHVIESTVRKFPISVLSIINGFDVETLNPTINLEELNTVLINFDLKTI